MASFDEISFTKFFFFLKLSIRFRFRKKLDSFYFCEKKLRNHWSLSVFVKIFSKNIQLFAKKIGHVVKQSHAFVFVLHIFSRKVPKTNIIRDMGECTHCTGSVISVVLLGRE
jgi:hypothetical protein